MLRIRFLLLWFSIKIIAYAVFANLSKVMELEFAPVLDDLVPHLCQVIGADEGQLEAAEADDAEKVRNSCNKISWYYRTWHGFIVAVVVYAAHYVNEFVHCMHHDYL